MQTLLFRKIAKENKIFILKYKFVNIFFFNTLFNKNLPLCTKWIKGIKNIHAVV
jgi:hypothetical protein